MFASSCDVCDIYAKIFIDGQQVLIKKNQNRSVDPPVSPSNENSIIPLATGTHTIEIEMTSSLACSGLFAAEFDDITIATTPNAPFTSMLEVVGGPYHSLELNQTSTNVTRPGSTTVELDVGWYDPSWPAQPVTITVMNATDAGIDYSIASISNTTEHQIFDITFTAGNDTALGEHEILLLVTEIETGYTVAAAHTIRVEG